MSLSVCGGREEGSRRSREQEAGSWAGNGHVPVMLPLSLSALLGVSGAINLCMQCIKFKLKEPPSSSSRILPATSTRFDTLQHWLGSACYQSTVHSPTVAAAARRTKAKLLYRCQSQLQRETERELTPPALSATMPLPPLSFSLSLCLWLRVGFECSTSATSAAYNAL